MVSEAHLNTRENYCEGGQTASENLDAKEGAYPPVRINTTIRGDRCSYRDVGNEKNNGDEHA
jgi:hypothetical protein